MAFSPVTLIVDDEPQALELLRRAFLRQGVAQDRLFPARTRKEAETLLQKIHFHGISIDQNIPMEEGGAVSPENGVALTAPDRWPLTKRVVYTGKGETAYANRVGFAGVEYREKAETSDRAGRRTLYDYSEEFVRDLQENYVEKALRAASKHLTHSLATAALEAADAKKAGNWPQFFRRLSALREWALRLTLAVTFASSGKKGSCPNNMTASMIVSTLRECWQPAPPTIRRYITMPGSGADDRLFKAMTRLRDLRNATEHFDYSDYVEGDFWDLNGQIVAVIDLLAFFCEIPIMHNVRFHHAQRGLLSFQKMGPNKVPMDGEWEDDFDPPPLNDCQLYMPWLSEHGPKLLSLSPWLMAQRAPNKDLEFVLLLGSKAQVL